MLEDNYRHKGMRRRLVNEIMDKGFTDERIMEAFLKIPRHFFFERAFLEKAYENKAFPIEFKGPTQRPEFFIPRIKTANLTTGKGKLMLVKKQLIESKENNLTKISEMEFYSNNIDIEVIE